jgi:sec-independent protein translocase protein TatA
MPIGPWELVIILIIVVVIFGAGRLSQIGGAVGKSVREFRSAVHEEQSGVPRSSATTAVAVAAPEVRCPSCEAPSAAGQKFCGKCGTPLTNPQPASIDNTCPSCATVNPPGQVFCGQCGTRLSRAA